MPRAFGKAEAIQRQSALIPVAAYTAVVVLTIAKLAVSLGNA